MQSECASCDRPAAAYWGNSAYCKACLPAVKADRPTAHLCIKCGQEQPQNVAWFRSSPCAACRNESSKYWDDA